jgi:GDPmannose 4,6-dehydratase
MRPVSPYGCSKLLSYNLTRYYREAYNLFACNGILFNHESYRRGSNFVTNKIIKSLILIKKGRQKKLYLGNLDASRDWGHSKDYVRAMHMILNYHDANDWIVSTGETKTIREFCKYSFSLIGLNYEDYVVSSDIYKRPLELNYLRGDSTQIRDKLDWKPLYTFEKMIEEMLEYWMNKFENDTK